jgi:alkylation response protein AidB-like acyl-CoA dehydrogenase
MAYYDAGEPSSPGSMVPTLPQSTAVAEEVERRFGSLISDRVNPGAAERDHAGVAVPRALLEEAGALGLLGYSLPGAIGGEGRDVCQWGLALEALGRRCLDGSFALLASLCPSIAATLHDLGREDLDQLYVRPMVQGSCLGAWSYTENADPFSFRSLATRSGSGWVLEGDKKLITGGSLADVFIVYVGNGAGDLMVFLVRRDDPGVAVRAEPTLGVRAAGLASLSMDGVRLGAERLLVGSDGLGHAQRYLNKRRALLVCPMLGAMRAALDGCIAQLGATERHGAPLSAISSVRSRVGRMAAGVEACRATLYRALASMRDAPPGETLDATSALAKYLITREAVAMGEGLLRLMGTDGYLEGPWERFLRDSLSLVAGGGTQDLLEVTLGAELARECELRAQRTSSVRTA